MNPLSLWEMTWMLGVMAFVGSGIFILTGVIVWAIYKPIRWLDEL